MLSGPLNFYATPPGLTFQDPVPYGIANNLADNGWIWPNENTGQLAIDFGAPTALGKVRVYSTYPGGPRGTVWAIEYSADNIHWSASAAFDYKTKAGGGVNDDGSARADTGGWYEVSFNSSSEAFRYWRVRQTAVTVNHAPRTGQMEFYLTPAPATAPDIHIRWNGSQVVVSWVDPTDTAVLQSAPKITGDWKDVPRSFSPQILQPLDSPKFFRLRR